MVPAILVEPVPSCASSSHRSAQDATLPSGAATTNETTPSTPLTRQGGTRGPFGAEPEDPSDPQAGIQTKGLRPTRGSRRGDRVDQYPAAANLSRGSTPPPILDQSKGAAKG